MSTLRLSIPAKPEFVVFSRLVLTGLSRTTEIDEETLGDLKVAVTEACSRSVRGADEGEGSIELRYVLADGTLTVEVEDEGRAFDLEAAGEDDTLSEDAMGLAIVEALVDELELEPLGDGAGSRLRFTKRLA
jgi:serine/threonine-protein kinase RsbW